MIRQQLDPAPREYAANVSLNRRSANATAFRNRPADAETIEQWLLHDAMNIQDMLLLAEEFCWRLTAAGFPVSRLALNVGTLHPQLAGFPWIWEADDGFCDEIRIETGTLQHPSYTLSPLYRAIEFGETIRGDPRDPELAARYPIMTDLAARGFADYMVAPLTPTGSQQQHRMSVSMASMQPCGLSGKSAAILDRLLRFLALHAARLMAVLVSQNIAAAYLGKAAGRQVLEGSISRGAGAPIEAVVLVADLRGFTDISGRLSPEQMLKVLNGYFEALAVAIAEAGGEVLKFIGDGLLAVFPITADQPHASAARQAWSAATQALAALDRLNAEPPAVLADIVGWRPLRAGVALHAGEVFFGNVGAPERLDFTVIGPAVDIAARLESLTKDLKRPLLVSGPVARMLGHELETMGDFHLRGIDQPVKVFAQPSADKDQS